MQCERDCCVSTKAGRKGSCCSRLCSKEVFSGRVPLPRSYINEANARTVLEDHTGFQTCLLSQATSRARAGDSGMPPTEMLPTKIFIRFLFGPQDNPPPIESMGCYVEGPTQAPFFYSFEVIFRNQAFFNTIITTQDYTSDWHPPQP